MMKRLTDRPDAEEARCKRFVGIKRFLTSRMAVHGLACLFTTHLGTVHANDLEIGQKIFESKCGLCHSLLEHKVGPKLGGVIGRKAGSAQGFGYTGALESAGFSWDVGRINAFLNNPLGYLPGTAMSFGGLHKASERKAVICYLVQHSPEAPLLPACESGT
ncbi:MAG TPA: hypothetical protein PLL83_10185 [Rhodoferax sp.]|jgi:cytochrome c|nr:hypothetical protein [Rhodoferax sp.]HQC86529.1 hypothetical protein [Rhodoferax sp.]